MLKRVSEGGKESSRKGRGVRETRAEEQARCHLPGILHWEKNTCRFPTYKPTLSQKSPKRNEMRLSYIKMNLYFLEEEVLGTNACRCLRWPRVTSAPRP